MYNLSPGEIPREPNGISVYLRQEKALSIQPIPEVFVLDTGSISGNSEVVFPLTAFETSLILRSIWVSTPGTRERDSITFKVLVGTSERYRYTIRERDMPVDLPFLVVTPSETLSIQPQSNITGVTVFAQQCYVVYRSEPG